MQEDQSLGEDTTVNDIREKVVLIILCFMGLYIVTYLTIILVTYFNESITKS